jgi:hypothetical protein
MTRPLFLAAALAVAVAGCSPRPEQPILAEFFNASRLRDRTALQKIATTVFDPAADGIVTTFEITGVSARETGGRAIEEVSISAPVRPLSGPTAEKHLVVTLERDVTGSRTGVAGRWVVTAVRDGAGPSTPPR